MRNGEGRTAEALHAIDNQLINDRARNRVEPVVGSSKNKNVRPARNGAGQTDTFLHTAR